MTTYYAAQLGISLSVVDSKASFLDELESQNLAKKSKLIDKCAVTEDIPLLSMESSLNQHEIRNRRSIITCTSVKNSNFQIMQSNGHQ